jgi:hypothetical protein
MTHHQIVPIAAPFARAGLRLDLTASDRMQRRLVFRGSEPTGAVAGNDRCGAAAAAAGVESFQLDSPRPGWFVLLRSVRDADGLAATLQAEGTEPGALLARVQAVPPTRQFHTGAGFRLACSGIAVAPGAGGSGLLLSHAVLQTDALRLTLDVPAAAGAAAVSATVALQPLGATQHVPADLLAVLGWRWSLLEARAPGWRGSVRLRGNPGSRSRAAEHALHAAAQHLVRTLAEPPRRFHERLRGARWRVMARQAVPALAGAVLALEAVFAEALRDHRSSPLTFLLLCIPPALLLLFLSCSEQPRLAWPQWPRPSRSPAWGSPP